MITESERAMIDGLRAAEAGMSPMPWTADHSGYDLVETKVTASDGAVIIECGYYEDCDAIALARNSLRQLLAIVDRLALHAKPLRDRLTSDELETIKRCSQRHPDKDEKPAVAAMLADALLRLLSEEQP